VKSGGDWKTVLLLKYAMEEDDQWLGFVVGDAIAGRMQLHQKQSERRGFISNIRQRTLTK
jgi:hypothetical protein